MSPQEQEILDRYLEHAFSYLKKLPSDEAVMRPVEEAAGVTEPMADDFRRCVSALMGGQCKLEWVGGESVMRPPEQFVFPPQLEAAARTLTKKSEQSKAMIVTETAAGGRKPDRVGKVRDIYEAGDKLVIVTTDRVSAYDVVMREGVRHKGRVLHGLTKWWMKEFGPWLEMAYNCPGNFSTHFITDDLSEIGPPWSEDQATFGGRTMLVQRLQPFPVECIVRGYLTGAGWSEYQRTGQLGYVQLPAGLQQNMHLLRPVFTPSRKAWPGQHDEPITVGQLIDMLDGSKVLAMQLLRLSVDLYERAAASLMKRGLILADTKFEFGYDPKQAAGLPHRKIKVCLIDEVVTPDSSRLWDVADYRLGGPVPSLDKQLLRDWLDQQGWDRQGPPPALPEQLTDQMSATYLRAYERVTGQPLKVDWP